MALLEINRDECIGCGDCVEVCPFGSLSLDDEDIVVVDETCTACGACLPECPVEALSLPERKVAEVDLSAYQGVWFWVEQFRGQACSISWEMAGKGRELADELGTTLRKLDFALTRGASVIEMAGDVSHEVTQTAGRQIRHIAKKQGVEILWHGSLTVPMCMPERAEWRDAHDHMTKSVRSAVYAGAKYVDFHACLNIWLELMTYAGRKLTMVFCDHDGNFIGKILLDRRTANHHFYRISKSGICQRLNDIGHYIHGIGQQR